MTQSRLRAVVFSIWLGGLFVSVLSLASAVLWRHDTEGVPYFPGSGSFLSDGISDLLPLWLPALSCLASFWFPKKERTSAKKKDVTPERTKAAIGITLVYMMFSAGMVAWVVWIQDYPIPLTTETLSSPGVAEQIRHAMKVVISLSPIALAPLHWLTS